MSTFFKENTGLLGFFVNSRCLKTELSETNLMFFLGDLHFSPFQCQYLTK